MSTETFSTYISEGPLHYYRERMKDDLETLCSHLTNLSMNRTKFDSSVTEFLEDRMSVQVIDEVGRVFEASYTKLHGIDVLLGHLHSLLNSPEETTG